MPKKQSHNSSIYEASSNLKRAGFRGRSHCKSLLLIGDRFL
ncbi:hypothetical protein [Nostoc sp.]